jgi:hypothetical protein
MKHSALWLLMVTSLIALPMLLRSSRQQKRILADENLRYAIDDLLIEEAV